MKSDTSLSESLYRLKELKTLLNNFFQESLREDSNQEVLGEEGFRYPFKHKSDLGKGPRGAYHHKAQQWDCDDCGRYYCDCEGIGDNEGHHKHVKIDPAYKHQYNKEYKAGKFPHWRERRSRRAERRKSTAS